MKKLIITCFILFGCFFDASAQLRNRPMYSLDWQNPWLTTENMAGLSENVFLQGERDDVSEAELGFDFMTGEFRNVFDPKTSFDGNIGVASHLKLNKTYLYGRFSYDYEYDKGNSWRGSLHPYESPFMLADNVEGNITDETYSMQAGFGLPLGNFSIGANVKYDVGIMAKLKDLRNRNTDMTFSIAPSVTYKAGPVRLGLEAGYKKTDEKVEYTQVAANTENYLYYLQGMWMFQQYGYSSAENCRLSSSNGAFGSFQIDIEADRWRIFNNFQIDWKLLKQTETGYNNLHYGDVTSTLIADKLMIQYSENHRLSLCYSTRRFGADRFLQQEEIDPQSGIRRYKDYGTPQRCWYRNMSCAGVEYAFHKAFKWDVHAGVQYDGSTQIYSKYPFSITQDFQSVTPYADFSKFFQAKNSRWEIFGAFSYKVMLKTVRNEIEIASGSSYESSGELQLLQPLNMEADYFGTDFLSTNIGVGCEFWRMFIRCYYSYSTAMSLKTDRQGCNIKIGIAF